MSCTSAIGVVKASKAKNESAAVNVTVPCALHTFAGQESWVFDDADDAFKFS